MMRVLRFIKLSHMKNSHRTSPKRIAVTDERKVLGRELAQRWGSIPHLTEAEAVALSNDIDEGRALLVRCSEPSRTHD
jgi:pyruvate/2-oxoglutarate dehydrogenase complex dihydrolipoamide acyltransferase (E2) component